MSPRVAILLLVLALDAARALAGGGPAEAVVLVNTRSADSRRVADHYVKARGIPEWQVCEVACETKLETPMADFVRDVADPLREFLRDGAMEDRVRFVVLTQGMPIRADTPGGAVSTTAALSLLHTPQCGADQVRVPRTRNPYTEGPACNAQTADGCRFLLVTALLSTTADEAMQLVDRSVASDGTAPAESLFLFQDATPAAHVRNDTYDAARAKVEALGHRTEHLKAGAAEATNRRRVMGYMAGGSYSALTADGVKTNDYLPGAISDHLQSFGAVPQNFDADAKRHTQFPITHMVRAGITGVHGAVAEPYNVAFPDADLFLPYLAGYTLAETFHQRAPLAYWMNLTLGDPLCAPYAARPAVDVKAAIKDGKLEVDAHAPGAVRIDVYAGGRLVASADAQRLTTSVAPESLRKDAGDGVLVEATGPGAHQPRGWRFLADVRTTEVARAAPEPATVSTGGTLAVEAPPTLVAGVATTIRVRRFDAAGRAEKSWNGRLEVRTAAPPVRLFSKDVTPDAEGAVDVPVRWTRAGDVELQFQISGTAVRAAHRARVVAAAPHHATTPLDRVPVLQPVDVPVVVEDAFGNVAAFDGEIVLAMEGSAELAAPKIRVTGGVGVFRDVVFPREGRQPLVFTSADGVFSQPGEGVTPVPSALRAWIVSSVARGTAAAKLFDADLRAADRDGAADAGLLFRRRREQDDVIDVPADKDGDTFAAVTFLVATAAAKGRVLAAAAGRLKVSLDGKTLFDGTTKQTDAGGAREQIAALEIAAGPHRLEVVTERKARLAFALEIAQETGKPGAPPVRVLPAATTRTPKSFVVSGRVTQEKNPVAGARILVKGSDGRTRTATTAADGTWFVEGLPAGTAAVSTSAVHGPPAVAVTLADTHAVDVDFALPE